MYDTVNDKKVKLSPPDLVLDGVDLQKVNYERLYKRSPLCFHKTKGNFSKYIDNS